MINLTNPFLERASEKTTSDQEFVRLFSPTILEKIPEDSIKGGLHIFRSSPGGGKTTILRAFTPNILRAFWKTRNTREFSESYLKLKGLGIYSGEEGPTMLGVLLSCASGYADFPPNININNDGLFKALINYRIVLRTIRSLANHVGLAQSEKLDGIKIKYGEISSQITMIPKFDTAEELIRWAEKSEKKVYIRLDDVTNKETSDIISHPRLESISWLQDTKFIYKNKEVAPTRLLMIDDLHKLQKDQRKLLIEELLEMRAPFPIWLAERKIAIGSKLLSQGSRENRDVKEYLLEEFWGEGSSNQQFINYAKSILDRRLRNQDFIPSSAFSQYLEQEHESGKLEVEIKKGHEYFKRKVSSLENNSKYSQWLSLAEKHLSNKEYSSLVDLFEIIILIYRNEGKRQLSLEMEPLNEENFNERNKPQIKYAAEIFIHEEVNIPYYFGIEKLCLLATNNVEEMLNLAASIFDGIKAKQALRKPDLILSPKEQEKHLLSVAKMKRDFIPKSVIEGNRAKILIDAIGEFCREKTFVLNAPYAPGVTGIRLSLSQFKQFSKTNNKLDSRTSTLKKVLSECVAENILIPRVSSASSSREEGTVYYLNRTMCSYYGLPLQFGGWQDIAVKELIDWMEHGKKKNGKLLES